MRTEALRRWQAFHEDGNVADLYAAVALFDDVLATAGPNDGNRPRALGQLAAARQVLYTQTGDLTDLEAAVQLTREAIARRSEPAAGDQSNLGNALRLLYEATGRLAALHEAIELARSAILNTPERHPARATRLSNLGYALRLRYAHSGRSADIDEAIAIGRASLAAEHDHAGHVRRMQSNLGVALRERHERTGDPADLDEAIRLATDSTSASPANDLDRPGMINNLGLALSRRHAIGGALDDLDAAIFAHRAAVEATTAENPDITGYALNLATAIRRRAEHIDDPILLDEAIDAAQFAESLLADQHPDRAMTLSALGRAYRLRHRHRGRPDDARLSVATRLAAAAVPTAPPGERAIAALTAAEWATIDRDAEAAMSGYSAAVALLGQVAWHGLKQADRERHLSRLRNVAQDASASALSTAQPDSAIELLEQGRSVIWSQYLQYSADLTALRTSAPTIAERLHEVQVALAMREPR